MPSPAIASDSQLDLRVSLAALRRRVEQLELFIAGHDVERPTDAQLVGLYVEATLILSRRAVPSASPTAWAHAVMHLDEENVFRLCRLVEDPHAFVPVAQLLVAFRDADDAETVGPALAHLRAVAQGVLDAQGLELIRLEDLLRRRLPLLEMADSAFDVARERGGREASGFRRGSVPTSRGASDHLERSDR